MALQSQRAEWEADLGIPKPDSFLKKLYLFIYLRGGREGEREGERHGFVASLTPPAGGQACNPGTCPDWEPNPQLLAPRLVLSALGRTSQGLSPDS